jgi:hypothetical protein
MELSKNNPIKNKRNLWKDVDFNNYQVKQLFYHNNY